MSFFTVSRDSLERPSSSLNISFELNNSFTKMKSAFTMLQEVRWRLFF